MFNKFFKAVTDFFTAPPIRTQFEDIVLEEAIKERNSKAEVPPVIVDAVPTHGAHAAPQVNDQITDSVTQAAPAKPKRAKTAKGKFAADDKATPEVNEAWEGGEAPAKKPRAPRKKKSDAKS
jgi:hypothetical protein